MFSLRLIISPSGDNALLCILLNGCKSWDLPIWLMGTNLVFGPMSTLGTVINNHFQWFFIHSQVVSWTACADQANKLKQLWNLPYFFLTLRDHFSLWTNMYVYCLDYCFIIFLFVSDEQVNTLVLLHSFFKSEFYLIMWLLFFFKYLLLKNYMCSPPTPIDAF